MPLLRLWKHAGNLPSRCRAWARQVLPQRAHGPAAEQTVSLEGFIERALRANTESLYADTIAFVESVLLTRVLQSTGGNQSRAARILGITRGSLRRKIRDRNISIGWSVGVGELDEMQPELAAAR